MKNSINELLKKEAQAVLNIPVTDAFEKAVDLIIEQGTILAYSSANSLAWYFGTCSLL